MFDSGGPNRDLCSALLTTYFCAIMHMKMTFICASCIEGKYVFMEAQRTMEAWTSKFYLLLKNNFNQLFSVPLHIERALFYGG